MTKGASSYGVFSGPIIRERRRSDLSSYARTTIDSVPDLQLCRKWLENDGPGKLLDKARYSFCNLVKKLREGRDGVELKKA
jgi:hypothetical protein